VRKDLAQLHEIQKSAFLHNHVPMRERCLGVWVLFSKLIQAPPRNDVHLGGETLAETFSDEKRQRHAGLEGRYQMSKTTSNLLLIKSC
jgi:hypothetical protein